MASTRLDPKDEGPPGLEEVDVFGGAQDGAVQDALVWRGRRRVHARAVRSGKVPSIARRHREAAAGDHRHDLVELRYGVAGEIIMS